jgi:nicotinamide phosphoribosyltransferase
MFLSKGLVTALDTDSYKASHYKQFPPGTKWGQWHLVARTGDPFVVWGGLQALLHNLAVPTRSEVLEMGEFFEAHGLPFNYAGWARIAELGFYPIKIRALPEGMLVPKGVPCCTVESRNEDFWIVSWLETQLLRIWATCNVASISYKCRRIILNFLEETADDPAAEIDYKLHDFGARGVSSCESAALSGLGHLFSFKGSDTVAAIMAARRYYGCSMAAFSITASEHSTITSWGEEHEADAYANMLDQFPSGLVACVSDSYDLDNAILSHWKDLKWRILGRKGTLVVRPDSGDPVETSHRTLVNLETVFGTTRNSKGYRVLPPQVRMIYGDGINPITISLILENLQKKGWSASNVAFGMGGALLQHHNRDTHGFAYKCNAVLINNVYRPVSKRAPGKKSLGGCLDVVKDEDGMLQATTCSVPEPHAKSELRVVYENGELENQESLDQIRRRLWRCGTT